MNLESEPVLIGHQEILEKAPGSDLSNVINNSKTYARHCEATHHVPGLNLLMLSLPGTVQIRNSLNNGKTK